MTRTFNAVLLGLVSFFVVGAVVIIVNGRPIAPPSLITTAEASSNTYTMTDVAAHAVDADCWSAVNGSVYDLTKLGVASPRRRKRHQSNVRQRRVQLVQRTARQVPCCTKRTHPAQNWHACVVVYDYSKFARRLLFGTLPSRYFSGSALHSSLRLKTGLGFCQSGPAISPCLRP